MDTLFGFEESLAKSLGCIPMAVRLKLDLVGIKLSLSQWTSLPVDTRRTLLEAPVGTDPAAWERLLADGLHDRAEELRRLPLDASPEWAEAGVIPAQVSEQCKAHGVDLPLAKWASMPDLVRFALCKLSRSGHENKNFPAAAKEFGL